MKPDNKGYKFKNTIKYKQKGKNHVKELKNDFARAEIISLDCRNGALACSNGDNEILICPSGAMTFRLALKCPCKVAAITYSYARSDELVIWCKNGAIYYFDTVSNCISKSIELMSCPATAMLSSHPKRQI